MDTLTLSGPEVPPASGIKPRSLIILLHGYGSNGQDLIGLVPFFASTLPQAHFIAPNAPFPFEMGPYGYQWFSGRDWSPQAILKGAHTASAPLNLFIDAQLKRFGLRENRMALIGFSQGTIMSLYLGLRRAEPCAGIVGYSGTLIGEEGITAKPPICLVHGQQDMVVPFGAMALAEAVLVRHDIPVESHARPDLGHSIDPEGITIACRFLKKKLLA